MIARYSYDKCLAFEHAMRLPITDTCMFVSAIAHRLRSILESEHAGRYRSLVQVHPHSPRAACLCAGQSVPGGSAGPGGAKHTARGAGNVITNGHRPADDPVPFHRACCPERSLLLYHPRKRHTRSPWPLSSPLSLQSTTTRRLDSDDCYILDSTRHAPCAPPPAAAVQQRADHELLDVHPRRARVGDKLRASGRSPSLYASGDRR